MIEMVTKDRWEINWSGIYIARDKTKNVSFYKTSCKGNIGQIEYHRSIFGCVMMSQFDIYITVCLNLYVTEMLIKVTPAQFSHKY